ncbi:MAG: HEAT repeat domain-containing protein, partial [Myxococcota bacterium]
PESELITSLYFEAREESAFSAVIANRSKYLGPLPYDQVHRHFAEHLHRPPPKMVLVLPVAVQDRTMALMYAENGDASISPRLANDLTLFLTQVEATLTSLLYPKPAPISTSAALIDRFDQEVTQEAGPQPPSTTPVSSHSNAPSAAPEGAEHPLEIPEAVNDSDLPIPLLDELPADHAEEPSFESAAAALASRVSIHRDSSQIDDSEWVSESPQAAYGDHSSVPLAEDADGTDLTSVLEGAPDRPDWLNEDDEQEGWNTAVTDDWDEWVSGAIEETRPIRPHADDATVPDLSAEAWIRSASEVTRAKPPTAEVIHRAELPETDSDIDDPVPLTQFAMSRQTVPVGALTIDPPFEVDEDDSDDDLLNQDDVINASFEVSSPPPDNLDSLIEQLGSIHPARREAAGEALAQKGPVVLPLVIARFPGVLSVDPFAPDVQLPAFSKCGVTLSLLERCGRDAHRHVVDRLDAPEPLHRFFAIYFYGAVYVPEAIPKLIQRLHDEEPRICMLAARTLFSYRDHRDFPLVLDHLHNRLKATSLTARRHAAYLIGLFRDVTAVPDLIQIFERKEKNLHDVVADALAEITKQRLGHSPKRWRTWWSKNRHRSRIEWLLDGLASKEPDLRQSASDELKAVTGIDLGFDGFAPRRQREEARLRWQKWWKAQQTRRRAVTPA